METPVVTTDIHPEQVTYKDSTYEIVSKIAYLIGVPKRIFANEYEPPQMEVYDRMEMEKPARIIRHLCIVRTAIERNYKSIHEKMQIEFCTVLLMPEYIPQDSVNQLSADGVSFVKKTSKLPYQHIIEINRLILDRINNCKKFFPLWLDWNYIRDLFIMPNGLCEEGTKEAATLYYTHMPCYPYQMYINWQPEDNGNVLFNDKKFVSLLYRWNNDYFTEYSKVSDVGNYICLENIGQLYENPCRSCNDRTRQTKQISGRYHAHSPCLSGTL